MENKEKYHFEDFTCDEFRSLLQLLKQKEYKFIGYSDIDKSEKFVLWRHDIDFSPQRALHCAKIEMEEGIKATYYLHLHSEYYNLLEKSVFEIINQIIEMGHDIGVHFDSHFYNIQSENEIVTSLNFEKLFLQKIFNTSIKSFSFHNTNPFILSCNAWEYAGLINTYATYFRQEVTYCSDSNGYWRYKRMRDVINEDHKNLHLLTHCEWWTEEVLSPWDKIQRAIDGRASHCKNFYLDFLIQNKMLNIDW